MNRSASPDLSAPFPPFRRVSDLLRDNAGQRPGASALADDDAALNWAQLDALVDRVAASLQRDGLAPGDVVAVCAASSVRYAAVYLGALRAGVVVAPLAPSVTPGAMASMLGDAQARTLFADAQGRAALPPEAAAALALVALDDAGAGTPWSEWLAPEGAVPQPVEVGPDHPFNIIYSSGTTGHPKGIVQSHGMRWAHLVRGQAQGYGPDSVTLLATPLYSNTTLVSFFPGLCWGGSARLMAKFDALRYLQIAQKIRATHSMLVPVQYQRIMALPQFGEFDLSSFRAKFCTSAPFRSDLKADILARWPGALFEFYGMTEGGGTCILAAHEHPDKLHTVGQPATTSDIRLIDEEGRELPPGATGEVVGHSPGMMTGYYRQPDKTREAEWFDATGKRFIRTGDVGRFDEQGFLTLLDRRKDMVISGGFNIYPSDLEAELRKHPAVADVAVTGVPSDQWGETPVAFVCRLPGATDDAAQLMAWYNARAGKTQRLSAVYFIDELPRSAIGKVLKRELRELHATLSR
ncbi:acyl-CoA synthetase (AMP-forming)/AMP-acid ligase II [Acidovorax sp. 69]|uniref:class I adenylate-forming enzyme family protein n=1 Tax=Acidovorax sp. 69 TaxID=2035202 RepID=UPI000C23351F|nr:class I adenylate-forming enzyme family protein [Acidovorax sp. 69]PJI99045.1 acyl-CoA synthetase (AMP-forming)/AMP-acid ligase II [Acidovorax sp. 69]